MSQPIAVTLSVSQRLAALQGANKRSGSAGEIMDVHGLFNIVRYPKKDKLGNTKPNEFIHSLSLERDNGIITGWKYVTPVEFGAAVLTGPEDFLSAVESLALMGK